MTPLRALVLTAAVAAFTLPLPGAVRADDSAPEGPDTKPIQLSLLNPVQIFPESSSVKGVRLSLIYGRNVNVTGLDVGLVNHTTKDFKGLQLGLVGLNDGDFWGWQWNYMANFSQGTVEGLQTSSVANITQGLKGFQFGMINVAEDVDGFQLGFINVTNRLHGLQIGILNVASGKEKFSVLPIVNWSF